MFFISYPIFRLKIKEYYATSDIKEAAKNLFACMRELDKLPGENIYAELLPERGLGLAINDRLRRAAAER
ncbi:MAG: hypothetical protein IPK25_08435 [Saprospiraceae bacterium]|nr:hypothetical protein [Saprospiraceae bacterium]